MALTNYDLIKIVNIAVNKDINGNAMSPAEFKTMINAHSMRLFAEKLGLTEEYGQGVPLAREGVSISKVNEMSLLPFRQVEVVAVVGGQLNMDGKDVAYIETVLPSSLTGRGFDELFPYELGDRLGDPITRPTLDDPIIVWRSPIELLVYPASINSVVVYYLKYPKLANFTISADPVTLLPIYSSIQELEWNDLEKTEIAYRMIREAGVNVERGDVTQYANQVVQTGK